MPKISFDTNIFIARKPQPPRGNFYLSVVVLSELVAGAEDESVVKLWDKARRQYEKAGRLLVPTSEDWWLAGKVINSLQRGLKSSRQGLSPKMSADEKHRIISDVLIARTARREGVTVITDNTKDFARIQKFCHVRILSGSEYFGS